MTRLPPVVIWHVTAGLLILFTVYHYLFANSDGGEGFPKKPIQVIVPYDPGGGTDTFARIIQKGVKDNNLMPQPLVIVNKPGGGTTIGSSFVKDARNDGYTLLCLHDAISTAFVTGQSSYGPEAFEAVVATGEIIQILLVSENSPYQSLQDFMVDGKNNPGTVKVGVTLSMPTHFTGLMLEEAAPGTRFRWVSSGGGAARLAALMGGHVDASFFSISEYIRFKENGLKPLAVFSTERHPGVPDIPTAVELGYDASNSNMHCWWLPKGTDPQIIQYLAGVLSRAMETDYVRGRLAELSTLPLVLSGAALEKRIQSRLRSFGRFSIKERVELPNVVAWTLGGIVLFGLGILRKSGVPHSSEPENVDSTVMRFDLVWICLIAVVVYVLVMALGWLSFVWATLLFVSVCALVLTGMEKARMLYVVEISLLMSFGVNFVFTEIFMIMLP